ncbi:MAG TPA: PhoX family phosphatase [Propionibacteriaceae bacterium]
MLGRAHGNRSPLTCHLKCDSACAYPAPNASTEATFAEIASRQLSRRSLLVATGTLAAATGLPIFLGGCTPDQQRNSPDQRETSPASSGGLDFEPIEPAPDNVDAMSVPTRYRWTPILRWGDPLFDKSPRFNPESPDADAQELQFGYNNDYLAIIVTDSGGRSALLCCNHEFTNRGIMFPPSESPAEERQVLRATMAAQGFSVVELKRAATRQPWRYVRGAARNRRITARTPFRMTGPAAGSDLLKTADDRSGRWVIGTFANCSGGTTPWGTILSGEENFHGYFVADSTAIGSDRYGLGNRPSVYGWEAVDSRFDATQPDYAAEPHRFGYIIEIDPYDPKSTPRKHTALGRFKHEGANIRIDSEGTVAAYMGDDERFEYLYKFVAKEKYRPGNSRSARRHNLRLLTAGDLYVAQFSRGQQPGNNDLGQGTWIPLTHNGESAVPGMSHDEVLIFTRMAADLARATPMDRCEDVQPSPQTGKVYVACTNNHDRGVDGEPGPDAANPRERNKNGHVIEITERDDRVGATSFGWNLFLVCGDTDEAGTYFGGWEGPVAPISCPDNLAFDSVGNLWIATDGAPGSISKADGLFRVPLEGDERGHLVQFLAVPQQAETCGPVIHDRDGSVFVCVQHPGEHGSWDAQLSFFPDYVSANAKPPAGAWRGPRPSVVQVTRDA